MSYYQPIEPEEEEEWLPRRRRPKLPEEPKPSIIIRSRFPNLPDGRPALGFATLSHSNLKSWAQVSKAQGHNTRTIDAPNVRDGAPEPIELLTEMKGSYTDRIKAVLREHGVPERIRKGGVIATEDVYGASPEYWNRNGDWKQKPITEIINDPAIQAAIALARRKYGKRLISCSLHIDEESPHIHVIAVPLAYREHAKRGRKPKACELDAEGEPIDSRPKVGKWTLDASSLRGQSSKLEANHDEWAEACAPLRLVRGAKGSEMTEEQRRARRNSQTGRSSLAEKVARERRERLEAEATANFEVARQLKDDFERAITEADEHEGAAKKAWEDAEVMEAAALAKLQEAEATLNAARADHRQWSDLLNTVLAEKVAAEEEKKAATAAKALALDIQREAGGAKFDADQAAALNKVVSDRLSKQLNKLNSREEALGGRESDLETAEGRRKDFIAVLTELLDPKADRLKPITEDGNFTIRGSLKPNEKDAIANCPLDLLQAARDLVTRMLDLNVKADCLAKRQDALSAKESDLDRRLQEVASTAAKVASAHELAKRFQEAWKAVPEDQRTPAVKQALDTAVGLTPEQLLFGANLLRGGLRKG